MTLKYLSVYCTQFNTITLKMNTKTIYEHTEDIKNKIEEAQDSDNAIIQAIKLNEALIECEELLDTIY